MEKGRSKEELKRKKDQLQEVWFSSMAVSSNNLHPLTLNCRLAFAAVIGRAWWQWNKMDQDVLKWDIHWDIIEKKLPCGCTNYNFFLCLGFLCQKWDRLVLEIYCSRWKGHMVIEIFKILSGSWAKPASVSMGSLSCVHAQVHTPAHASDKQLQLLVVF